MATHPNDFRSGPSDTANSSAIMRRDRPRQQDFASSLSQAGGLRSSRLTEGCSITSNEIWNRVEKLNESLLDTERRIHVLEQRIRQIARNFETREKDCPKEEPSLFASKVEVVDEFADSQQTNTNLLARENAEEYNSFASKQDLIDIALSFEEE